jgi:hypothetical protein
MVLNILPVDYMCPDICLFAMQEIMLFLTYYIVRGIVGLCVTVVLVANASVYPYTRRYSIYTYM